MEGVAEFQYRVPWRARSSFPGSHPGVQRGAGYEVHGIGPLYAVGDPRRLDLRASLRDPFGQLLVRIYKQRSIVPVYVLADVSASMGFVGNTSKFELLIQFVRSLAYSANRVGDPFAFTGCDTVIREELTLPATRAAGVGEWLCGRLRRFTPSGDAATGLLAGAAQLPAAGALVFLISDYYLPVALLRDVLSRLCRHAVVPVVLVDSAEARIPGAGLTHLCDAETGARKTLLLRRSLALRLAEKIQRRAALLRSCLAAHDLKPLYVIDRFEAERVTGYFHG